MEISLKLPKTRFVASENVAMTVSVTNRTADAIEIPDPFHSDNWQPVYTIKGPGNPNGRSFTFRSVALKDSRQNPPGVAPVLVKLAPGQTLEKDVPLQDWAKLQQPGVYEISARLTWSGISAEAIPVKFEIAGARLESISLGVDANARDTVGEWLAWFDNGPKGHELFTAVFQRPHVDVRGYEPFTVTPLYHAGPGATDVLSPWTNYNRQAELEKWIAWREGSTLFALVMGTQEPHKLDIKEAPSSIVRPALMKRGGELDIFYFFRDAELVLARFSPSAASILWHVPVPARPVTARAAIGPEDAGSPVRIALASQDGDMLSIHLMAIATDKAGAWETSRLRNARLAPNTQIGMMVDDAGRTHVAVPYETGPDYRELAIVDISYAPSGKIIDRPELTRIGELDSPATAAAASYVVSAGAPQRREWAVWLQGGETLHSGNPSHPSRLKAAPILPPQMISLASGSYFLSLGPQGTPQFTLLD